MYFFQSSISFNSTNNRTFLPYWKIHDNITLRSENSSSAHSTRKKLKLVITTKRRKIIFMRYDLGQWLWGVCVTACASQLLLLKLIRIGVWCLYLAVVWTLFLLISKWFQTCFFIRFSVERSCDLWRARREESMHTYVFMMRNETLHQSLTAKN